ncbi:trehalose-phosphatase [Consotaella aegiceratis]|uniref:trehalose-phosphatase n=1 Tax=Consotaella aegiceratis TaxID=3097961 RepID=UPI002F3F212A
MTIPPPLDPQRHALFLDFDGTLVDLVDDPDAVRIAPHVLDRLSVLQSELSGALAVVSGRRIADLDRFLSPLRFAAAGVHGLERRADPGDPISRLMEPEALDTIRRTLQAELAAEPRLKLEDKGMALVLHYRTAPDLAGLAAQIMAGATDGREDLVVMKGDQIVEVHPAGMDKGVAVADLMGQGPFIGRTPIYAGDDVTDEYALRHVSEAGGISIKIGGAATCAEYRLADVSALHDWLGAR